MNTTHQDIFTRQDFVRHPYLAVRIHKLLDQFRDDRSWIRLANILLNEDVLFVAEVLARPEREWMYVPNFGQKTFNLLERAIILPLNLKFASSFPEFTNAQGFIDKEGSAAMRGALIEAEKERHTLRLQAGDTLESGEVVAPSAPDTKPTTAPQMRQGLSPRQLLIKQREARALRGRGLSL